ncbi:branched-chain amino acid ABC transporter permease [Cupriavidus sp. LEh25]|nr:branched-chain amino acid ABC transporter permease [Cupriavidus sp. LEh25]
MTEFSLPSTVTPAGSARASWHSRVSSYVAVALVVLLLLAPQLGVYPVFVMKILCFALFAAAFNLLLGYTGLLSFGHAALFGGAGYMAGYAIRTWHVSTEVSLLIGVATAVAIGFLMGVLAIRRQGIYFSMITLALAQMFFFICLQTPQTGGEDGLQGVPRGALFGVIDLSSDVSFYYLVVTVFVAAMCLIARIVSSPFGQLLHAVKENESRAISLGYSTDRFKLMAFVLSAALAGLAGAMKALVLGFATLADVHWAMSGAVILMTLVGGMGTLSGPVVGALVIVILENKLGEMGAGLAGITGIEWFASLGESVTLVTGVIFIVCVLLFRKGLVGAVIGRFPSAR